MGSELISGFHSMYSSINGEVSELGRQLGDAYRQAMEDNIIDVDEAKLIQKLQEELAAVTQQVSEAQFHAKLKRMGDQYSGKDLDLETFQNLQAEVNEVMTERRNALNQSTDAVYAALELQMQRGEITPSDYARKTQATGNRYNESLMRDNQTAMQFSVDTIMDTYGDALARGPQRLEEWLASYTQDLTTTIETGEVFITHSTQKLQRKILRWMESLNYGKA